MQIEIKKAKRKGDGLQLTCNRTEGGQTFQSPAELHPAPIHPNLDKALNALRVHYAGIMGFVNPKKIRDFDTFEETKLEDYRLNGFAIDRKGDGVVLIGMIKTPAGKWSALNTPNTLFEQEETTRYSGMDDLIKKLDEAKKRVYAYLAGDEIGEAKQGTLEMPEVAEMAEAE